MIGPTDMTSRIIASADPNPIRLASPMMLFVIRTDRTGPLSPGS
jgi:hypothetical protein